MTDGSPRTSRVQRAARSADPNYAARRMLVSAVVIAAVVVAASVVWRSLGGKDEGPAALAASWDAVALVATTTGDTTLVDATGAVVARHDGAGRVSGVHAAGSRLALVHADAVTLLDLAADGDDRPLRVELDARTRSVTRLRTSRDRLLLAAGNRNGGRLHVIDGERGETFDVAEMAGLSDPLLFTGTLRVDAAGTAVAVADANSFQTIVVRGLAGEPTDDGDGDSAAPAIENYADQPLSVNDRLLATTQVVGGRADLSLHVSGGPIATPVAAGIPAGGTIVDGALVAVTTDGSVIGLRPGDRQVRQLGTLGLPAGATVTRVYPAASGERLVVYADSYLAVLDAAGAVIYEAEFTARAAEIPEPLVPAWAWTCLAVGLGTPDAAIVSLTDGTALTRLAGVDATDASADGCTVLGTRASTAVVVGTGGTATLGAVRQASLSPDGRLVVRRLTDGTTELVPITAEITAGTPIDISDAAPTAAVTVAFVDR